LERRFLMQKVPYSEQDLSVPRNAPTPSPAPRRTHTSWIVSLTLVCFIFGGLLAAQLRAVERVRTDRQNEAAGQDAAQDRLAKAQKLAEEERQRNEAMGKQLTTLKTTLAKRSSLSEEQAKQLNAQISELQLISGLTPISGPGVTVRISDNPDAADAAGGAANAFAPGLVHDFDLLQVVNELRSAKAEAIAVNGRRITGYSPIRCVGPVIYVNWEAAASPFIVQAIGDTDTLTSALKMPLGIIDNLKNQGGLGIKITTSDKITLPAVESRPKMRRSKVAPATRTD
jgi:uncharacterized protein YlxW (UPF0749 family)